MRSIPVKQSDVGETLDKWLNSSSTPNLEYFFLRNLETQPLAAYGLAALIGPLIFATALRVGVGIKLIDLVSRKNKIPVF